MFNLDFHKRKMKKKKKNTHKLCNRRIDAIQPKGQKNGINTSLFTSSVDTWLRSRFYGGICRFVAGIHTTRPSEQCEICVTPFVCKVSTVSNDILYQIMDHCWAFAECSKPCYSLLSWHSLVFSCVNLHLIPKIAH